jgi:hypothetical protein
MAECRHTWKEWKDLGFSVVKGEKSCGRNASGQCVFSESQVIEAPGMSQEEIEMYGWHFEPDI